MVSPKRTNYGTPPVRPVAAPKPRTAKPSVTAAIKVKPVGIPRPTKKGT